MKKLTRYLAAVSAGLFVFPHVVYAEGPGWVYNVTVVALVDTANGGVNVRVSPDFTACTSQSGYGPKYASIYPSHPALSRMKADLLTAFITGTPVSLYSATNMYCR